MDREGESSGQSVRVAEDATVTDTLATRVPLEHALALDALCSSLSPDAPMYVVTEASTLLQAVVERHDHVVVADDVEHDIVVPDPVDFISVADETPIPPAVQRVLLLEPTDATTVRQVIDAVNAPRHDCLVANPLSYNRIEDRAVAGWGSPRRVRQLYSEQGFETAIEGYHGPRSIARSVLGRLWQARGRPDRRDRYTHRMRAAYRERWWPLALLSCLVHVVARERSA